MILENSAYRVSTLRILQDQLEIRWQDRHQSHYPAIWLLEACQCELCGKTLSAVRHVRLIDKPARPPILSASHNESQLVVDWGNGHHSRYPLDWLRSMCLSPQQRAHRKFKPSLWGREMRETIPYANYPALKACEDLQLEFLESILNHGFAILQQVPAALEHTEEVASLVGKLRMTNYGIYELESRADPEIVGDTALPLAPHTDEPYRIDPPAITFFHVITQSEVGGASTLLDSFRLVQRLRESNPGALETLSTVSAGFHRELSEGRLFSYQHPVIQIDSDGDTSAVRMLDRGMAPVDSMLGQVEEFYEALREFMALANDGVDMIEFKLAPGEVLVFNNQRLMHGRTAFNPSTKRHVRSCSVDLDEFYSRLRILYASRNNPRQWMTFRKD